MRKAACVFVVGVALFSLVVPAFAQPDPTARLDQLTARVNRLESRLESRTGHSTGAGAAVFLFGAFCALWAQNTKRNPWLWFLLGVVFNVITIFALLVKNADDLRAERGEPAHGTATTVLAIVLGVLVLAAFLLLYLPSFLR